MSSLYYYILYSLVLHLESLLDIFDIPHSLLIGKEQTGFYIILYYIVLNISVLLQLIFVQLCRYIVKIVNTQYIPFVYDNFW